MAPANMETIMMSVSSTPQKNFPHMLSNFFTTNMTAIYATNINDVLIQNYLILGGGI